MAKLSLIRNLTNRGCPQQLSLEIDLELASASLALKGYLKIEVAFNNKNMEIG